MTHDDIKRAKDDLSFMRELAADDGKVLEASGVGLMLAGLVFGLLALRFTLIEQGWLDWPAVLEPLMPFDGVVIFFVSLFTCFIVMGRKSGMQEIPSPNAASRAMWAAWAAAGVGFGLTQIGFSLAGGTEMNGIPLFAFWGSGWFVVWAIYRRAWQLVVTVACYGVVILAGLLWDSPYHGFVGPFAFFAVVGAPGILVYRQARAFG
jgi:hypothetical protein